MASCPGGRFPHSSNLSSNHYHRTEQDMTVCPRPEDGLRCRQGVQPRLLLYTVLARTCEMWFGAHSDFPRIITVLM